MEKEFVFVKQRSSPSIARIKMCLVLFIMVLSFSCATDLNMDSQKTADSGLAEARTIYIHGAGDNCDSWATKLLMGDGDFALDWSIYAADKFSAPARGYQLGLELSKYLNDMPRTIYAHSAGAWVAQGLLDGFYARGDSEPVAIVFLDPFTALSLFQPFAGSRMLGMNASSVETIYTTRDSIPFTKGMVAAGRRTNIDDLLPVETRGAQAHWAVIDWYMAHR
jgi:hypothetical protein